jgi:hypothetical protein
VANLHDYLATGAVGSAIPQRPEAR